MWLWQYHHCCDKCLRSILYDYTNKTLWWESISVSLVLSPLMVSRYWSKHNVTLSDSITHCLRSYHWPEYCDQETMIPWAPLCLCCHQRLQCPLSQMMVTTDSLQQFCTIFAHVCTSVASISGVQYAAAAELVTAGESEGWSRLTGSGRKINMKDAGWTRLNYWEQFVSEWDTSHISADAQLSPPVHVTSVVSLHTCFNWF